MPEFFFFACTKSKDGQLFEQVENSGIQFTNTVTDEKDNNIFKYRNFYNGGGVGIGDINNDGLQDIYFTGNMVSGKLYLNKGNMKFEDITQKAGVATSGWTYGVSVVDINQDGYKDIYICKGGNRKTPASEMKNLFFINNKDNTFSEVATQMNLADDGYDIQAAFLDYDKDGDLDMYLLRNAFVNYNRNNARPKETQGKAASTDKLYRNDGAQENGIIRFTDVSKEEGITIEGFGLGISVCDLNQDNWPDLYVSNDFLTNDLVYINTHKNGKHLGFINQAHESLRHTTYNGMGNDVADFNNDGKTDIFSGDSWYEAPSWKKHKIRDIPPATENPHYHDDFANSPLDVNGDGRIDIVTCNYFAKRFGWLENPGPDSNQNWTEHTIDNPGNMETGELVDINGDGKPDFLPNPEKK